MINPINPIAPPFKPFTYKTLEHLQSTCKDLNLKIPISSDASILKSSVNIGKRIAANRLVIQPMEGFDSELNGAPSDYTRRRYMRYAKSGVGSIWFEATAISADCRSNEHQLILNKTSLKAFMRLVSLIRAECDKTLHSLGFKEKSVLILQLNHSGRYTNINNQRYPLRAVYNEFLDSNFKEKGTVVTDEYLKYVEDLWIQKAILAEKAGFDGVDIKACHGYLISELLGSTTRQNSIYGEKKIENRSRLLINIVKEVNKQCKSSDFLITTRFNLYDGIPYPYGFGVRNEKSNNVPAPYDLSEPIKVLKELQHLGVKLVNLSAGDPHFKPFITRPFDVPVQGGEEPPEHPLFSLDRLISMTSSIKNQFRDKLTVIGSGYSYLRQFAGNVCAGLISNQMVDLVGFGRMSFANPQFATQIFHNGVINKNLVCITCSKCSQLMRNGKRTGCSVRDPMYKNSLKN